MNIFTKHESRTGQGHVSITTAELTDEADVRDHYTAFFDALDTLFDDVEEGRDVISVSITVVRREALN
jgi:hypothetical protein